MDETVKKKFAELDKQLPMAERFKREAIWRESEQILEEIPELTEFVDNHYGELNPETEQRFEEWQKRRPDG